MLPAANAEVTNTIDDLFDMCLLECLDVYVTSQAFLCYYRLYLQRLQCIVTQLFSTTTNQNTEVATYTYNLPNKKLSYRRETARQLHRTT